ncbi:hypothetical protein TNCV_4860121 [Trichonephila clavipes]|nr:hypothetical protein TNCV_4860121 [Trichonephila clavipes]
MELTEGDKNWWMKNIHKKKPSNWKFRTQTVTKGGSQKGVDPPLIWVQAGCGCCPAEFRAKFCPNYWVKSSEFRDDCNRLPIMSQMYSMGERSGYQSGQESVGQA